MSQQVDVDAAAHEGAEARRWVLAIDCSTSAAKATVFDGSGRSRASGRQAFAMHRPRVGWHEQNAEDWWAATQTAVRAAVSSIDATRIAAVVITHQRETFVCLDAKGVPVRPAIVWADNRSAPQVAAHGSEETHRISGRVPDITPSIFKLAWLAENEPQTLAEAALVADVSAYLTLRLTGHWAASSASSDSLGLMDLEALQWSAPLCAIAGVDVDQLPRIVEPGAVVAPVLASVASELGLAQGVPLVAGAGDGQCAALGAGMGQGDEMYLNIGTAIVAGFTTSTYQWSRRYRTVLEGAGRGYLLETLQQAGTYLVSWFIENFPGAPSAQALIPGLVTRTPEQDLEVEATAVPVGSDGLLALPYWNAAQTPYWDGQARGAVIGWTGSHTRAHFYRAILEGIAYEIRLGIDGIQEETGRPVHRLLTTGGGSRSALWSQIVADVTGRRVDICAEAETTSLGAALLATTAIGVHADLEAASKAMTAVRESFHPRETESAAYSEAYRRYLRLYPAVKDLLV